MWIKRFFPVLFCIGSALRPQAQTLDKIARLPDVLNEISGLIAYNDSLFLATTMAAI